jgi:hypothetical protein
VRREGGERKGVWEGGVEWDGEIVESDGRERME